MSDMNYNELRSLGAESDALGSPAFLTEARNKCIEAAELCDAYLVFKPHDPFLFRMLVEDAQDALAKYGVAIVEYNMGRKE